MMPSIIANNIKKTVLIFMSHKLIINKIIKYNVKIKIVIIFLSLFLYSSTKSLYEVLTIIIDTAILIPKNAYEIIFIWRKFFRYFAIISIIISEGSDTPSVATTAPLIPQILYPIYVAIFIAIGPGVLSATDTTFKNSSWVINLFLSIN